VQTIQVTARDGTLLAGDLYEPSGAPRAAALVAPAMATPRRFYAAFARHLADAGYATLAVDYRGVGGSRPALLRGYRAALHEWGEQDLAGAADLLAARYPSLPLAWIGHSVGGQLLGIVERVRVDAALLVAAQNGHWRHWPSRRGRALMFGLWHAFIPASVAIAGYLPMRRLRQGEDVPAGVALEWARWGRHREYVWSYAAPRGGRNFVRYAGPLRGYAMADDHYAPVPAHEALLARFTATAPELRVVRPADVGEARVGHFGFFKPAVRTTLWADAVGWLDGALARGATADGATASTIRSR
jgi:predicted alpha/beta hydrolase